MNTPPVALTIAGSDNSSGAGIQADLKTFSSHGVYGLTAITCIVAEVPGQVSAIQPVELEIVAEQIRLSFKAYPVAAVKTGMLHSREIIGIVCDELEKQKMPVVVDPVMIATSGDPLLKADAVDLFKTRLFKRATLVTPNLDEAGVLLGHPVTNEAEMREAGHELVKKFGVAFLLKGGHLRGDKAIDLLFSDGKVFEFAVPYVHGVSTHGTGCTYSAAITASLAKGLPLAVAVSEAKHFVTRAIANHFRWKREGGTTHALNHFK
ncbi:MAG: bifunctional hydroxymethylpyrimidine kinase/phosphomethylpyrimidine kinase [Verrucomicrobiota bacterium]